MDCSGDRPARSDGGLGLGAEEEFGQRGGWGSSLLLDLEAGTTMNRREEVEAFGPRKMEVAAGWSGEENKGGFWIGEDPDEKSGGGGMGRMGQDP